MRRHAGNSLIAIRLVSPKAVYVVAQQVKCPCITDLCINPEHLSDAIKYVSLDAPQRMPGDYVVVPLADATLQSFIEKNVIQYRLAGPNSALKYQ